MATDAASRASARSSSPSSSVGKSRTASSSAKPKSQPKSKSLTKAPIHALNASKKAADAAVAAFAIIQEARQALYMKFEQGCRENRPECTADLHAKLDECAKLHGDVTSGKGRGCVRTAFWQTYPEQLQMGQPDRPARVPKAGARPFAVTPQTPQTPLVGGARSKIVMKKKKPVAATKKKKAVVKHTNMFGF